MRPSALHHAGATARDYAPLSASLVPRQRTTAAPRRRRKHQNAGHSMTAQEVTTIRGPVIRIGPSSLKSGLLALLNICSAQELINQRRPQENGPIDDDPQDIGENVLEADSFLCWWKAIKANGKLKSGRSSRQHQSRQRRLLSVVPSALIPPALAVSVCNPEALLLFLTVSFAYVDDLVYSKPHPN